MARTRGISTALASKLLAAAVAFASLLPAPEAQAQKLQADPKANQANQPTINNNGSGKAPSVNIVKPNAGGVSHNIYTDFNVGKPGLVMNNATQAGQSQLLGQLGANPNLTSGPAKLILNEVTGGNISQLLGYIEIFGAKADFILANPAGVTCNGCGFINTPRATFTTGMPDFNADGTLKGFNVSGSGQIRFEGAGADIAGLQTFDVVSRSIFMGGAIDDKNLQAEVGLFAGFNSFDYASRSVGAIAGDGTTAPAVGVQMSGAGAVKAGRIGVTSTEKGVGVVAQGLSAGGGGMMLTADGKLQVVKARSQGAISLKSQSSDIQITDKVWSQASLSLWAGGNIAILSQASAGALGNVSVNAQGITLSAGAVLGAGLDDQGKFTGNGALNLYAANLSNAGTIQATGDVALGLTAVLANQASGTIQAGGALTVTVGSFENYGSTDVNGARGTLSGQTVTVSAGDFANAGKILASQALTLNSSGTLVNVLGTIQAGGTLSITAAGNVENLSGIVQGQTVSVNAQTIESITLLSRNGQLYLPGVSVGSGQSGGSTLADLQTLFGKGNGAFLNSLGLTLDSSASSQPQQSTWFASLRWAGSGSSASTALQQASINATSGLALNAAKDIVNTGGKLNAGGDLALNAGGNVISKGQVAGSSVVQSGISAGGSIAINAGGDATLRATDVKAGQNVALNAQGQVTVSALETETKTQTATSSCDWLGFACKTTSTTSTSVTQAAASIDAGGWISITSKTGAVVNLEGTITAGGAVTVNAAGNFENLSGVVKGQDIAINAQTIENVTLVARDGQLVLPQAVAALLGVADASQAQGQNQTVKVLGVSSWWGLAGNSGSSSSGQVTGFLVAGPDGLPASGAHTDVAATQASITATNGVTLNASKDINNVGGKVTATGGDLTVNAGGSTNIQAQEVSTVRDANNLTTTHVKSALTAGGNIVINAGGDTTIQATDVKSGKNTTVTAGGAVTLSAAQDEKKTYSSSKKCDWLGFSCKTSVHSTDDKTVVASTFTSGGWIEIEAKTGDIHATATNANAQGSIKLLSDQGNILADAGENSTYNQSYTKKSQWWGLTGSAHGSTDSSTTIEPTWVSAVNDVQLIAHADLTLKAATVKAGGSVTVDAQTVTFIALQNTVYHYQMDENWGFYASAGTQQGSASVSVGWQDTKTTSSTKEGLAQVTDIEAGGNISIAAKGDINSEGAIVAASGSVTANAGGDINLTAAYDTYTATSSKSSTQIGLTLSANENVSSAIDTYANAGKDWNAGQGSDAAKNITRASEALKLVETTANLIFGQLVSVSASIGFSHSTSKSSLSEHLVHAGYWVAGNDVSIASGNNVNIQGTVSQAGRCLSVNAANNLTIQSALSTIDQKTSFQSESASVGVSFGVGLTGFSLAGNASVGFQTGNSSLHQATNVMSQLSGGTVTLKSGRDTTVAGATVTGGTVTADVGGNLSVESRQDTLTSRNSQTGFSLGIGIGLGTVSSTAPGPTSILGQTSAYLPVGYSPNTNILSQTGNMLANPGGTNGTATQGNTGSIGFTYVRGSEDKAWTNQQTSITGTDAVTLNVASNTNVKGAIVDAKGAGLTINTGTFTYENIHDYDKSKNVSANVNLSFSLGGAKPASEPGKGGGDQQGSVLQTLENLPGRYADAMANGAGNALGLNADQANAAQKPAAQGGGAGLRPEPSMLTQVGETLAKYPAKVQGSYKATDKEQTTFAAVGNGAVNVKDTAKQAALEKDGKTAGLDKLNRDVTRTQVITKNKTDLVNFYASTDSLITVAKVAQKVGSILAEIIEEGKILTVKERQVKELKEAAAEARARGVHLGDFRACINGGGSSGGSAPKQGFLFNLLFTPAYAADTSVDCFIRFFGAEKLKELMNVDADGIHIDRAKLLEKTQQLAGGYLKLADNEMATLAGIMRDHPDDYQNREDYKTLDRRLQDHLSYFALCSTDDQWTNFIGSRVELQKSMYAAYIKTAEGFKRNQQQLDEAFFELPGSKTSQAQIAENWKKYAAIGDALLTGDHRFVNDDLLNSIVYLRSAADFSSMLNYSKSDNARVFYTQLHDQAFKSAFIDYSAGTSVFCAGPCANALLSVAYYTAREVLPTLPSADSEKWLVGGLRMAVGKTWEAGLGYGLTYGLYDRARNYPIIGDNIANQMGYYTPVIDRDTGKTELVQDSGKYYQHYIDSRTGKDAYVVNDGIWSGFVRESNWDLASVGIDVVILGRGSFVKAAAGEQVAKAVGETVVKDVVADTAAAAAARSETAAVDEMITRGGCFTAGTLVETSTGPKPIEEIQVGDLVQARDENSGRTFLKPVLRLFHRHGQEIYNVKIRTPDGQSEAINATAEHPFHVRGKGWVGASKLVPGETVEQFDGQGVRVVSVERDPALQDTYNFEVDEVHSYFVGKNQAWVHNQVICNKTPSGGSPALRGDPYSPAAVEARIKPPYEANPAHDPRSALFNPRKTPEPLDAADVYQNSVRGGMGEWFGIGQDGKIYRFFSDNAGSVHFSGIVPQSQVDNAVLKLLGR